MTGTRGYWKSLALIAAGIGGACWGANIGKPLRTDEIIFKSMAEVCGNTGKPVIHDGSWTSIGLWHPPLLHYVNAVVMAIFGDGDFGFRVSALLGTLTGLFFLAMGGRVALRP